MKPTNGRSWSESTTGDNFFLTGPIRVGPIRDKGIPISRRPAGGCKRTSPFRRTERRCDQWRAVPRIRSDQVVFGFAKDLQPGRISLRHLCVIPDTSQSVLSLIEQLACPWFSRSLVSFPSFLRLPSFPPPPRIFLGHRAYSTYCLVLYRRIPRSPSLPLSGDRARHH